MHILVVDDKQAVRDSLIKLLESSGYTVHSACNGLDAFEKAQKCSYDLFIIDHLMPIMNGLQLAKNLSQQAATMLTPILFMTTQGIETINKTPEAQLFNAILSKPINEENLLSQVIQLNIKNIQLHSL
mgnify:CR=1 FL=1